MIQIALYMVLFVVDVNYWPQASDVLILRFQTLASDFSSPWGCHPRALFRVTQMPDHFAWSNEKSERHKKAMLGALTQK